MISIRCAYELVYQLERAGELDRLASALSTVEIFQALYQGETRHDVLVAWSRLASAGIDPEERYRNSIDRYLDTTHSVLDRIAPLHDVGSLLDTLGKWTMAIAVFGRMLREAEAADDGKSIAAAEQRLARLLFNRGDVDEATHRLARSLAIYQELGDEQGISYAIGTMGYMHYRKGEYDEALRCHRQQESHARAVGDRKGIAIALSNIGNVHADRGEYDEALKCYLEHESIARQLGDRVILSHAIGNLGALYHGREKYDEALRCYREYETIARELGDPVGISIAVGNMGNVHWSRGKYDEALRCYREKESIARELGDRSSVAKAIGNMGLVYVEQGKYDEALRCYQEHEAIARELEDRRGVAIAVGHTGVMYAKQGEHEKALGHLQEALRGHRSMGERTGEIYWLEGISMVLIDLAERGSPMPEFLATYLRQEARADDAPAPDHLDTIRTACLRQAREAAQECLAISEQLHRPEIIYCARVLLARAMAEEQGSSAALHELEQMLKHVTDKSERADLHYWIWKIRNRAVEKSGSPEVEKSRGRGVEGSGSRESVGDTEKIDHRAEAVRLYIRLIERTPKHEFRSRLDELTSDGGVR